MSKYAYAKRLRRMLNNECEIAAMETKIARKSAKCYEKIAFLKTMMVKQENELCTYRREVDRIKYENEKLEEFIQAEEESLKAINENVERLRGDYKKVEEEFLTKRKQELAKKEFIRCLKEATQTYFNMDALPERFQGVRIIETETSCNWEPFSIDGQEWMQYLEEQWSIWQKQNNNMDINCART
ncbi:spc25 [Haematobia irritans]|uniref:spc25 n=1 Tax=Haematobia irritans TaxID=7368 RepID=UPI003F4FD980